MTRYDPFAYGNVRLDPNQPEGEPQGEPTAEIDHEDLLFDGGEPTKQAPPADASWALLNEDVDGLLPQGAPPPADSVAFGAEILGEDVGDAVMQEAQPAEPAVRARPETGERPAPSGTERSPSGPTPGVRREVRRRVKKSQESVPGIIPEPARLNPALGRRRRSMGAALLPLMLCAGGGTAAAWFWVMQDNPVMAGIIGVTTLVGALFTWLLLRG